MALITDTEIPIFPQEIVELILDEVAALDSPQTLGACALVSRSFYSPSRRHLYSDIFLVMDGRGDARARRIVETLETFRERGVATNVHSLTLIVDISSKIESESAFGSRVLGPESKGIIGSRISEELGLWRTNLEKLLGLVIASQLTRFTLQGRGGVIKCESHLQRLIRIETLHSLFTLSSLKSLRISHLAWLDNSLVGDALRSSSLQELTFVNVSFPLSYITRPAVHITNSHLRSLDVRRSTVMFFLRNIGYSGHVSSPPSLVTFTRLQRLVISGNSYDRNLGKFILEVADTLETLEIEDIDWERHICLDQLTSLRNLKIVTASNGSDSPLLSKQAQLCHLLSSATSPTRIQTINLHLNVHILPRMSYPDFSAWTELDNGLSGGAFVNLSRLDLRLHLIYTMASDEQNRNVGYIGGSDFLPQVASNPLVDYRLAIRTICTPLCMPEYLHSSR